MDTMKFRTLEANEIDLRVATINDNGLSLLLYKDARADMNILDETIGIMNWKREHSRDNANCTVSIWDDEKKQWITKEDTGAESFTEKEKGLASDSFKRACVNWGIGRELYTAPFIWIKATDFDLKERNGKKTTFDKFVVTKIEYDNKRNITALEIKNTRTNRTVFKLGGIVVQEEVPQPQQQPAAAQQPAPGKKCSKAMLQKMYAIAQKKGYTVEEVKKLATRKYGVAAIEVITDIQLKEMLQGFEGCQPKGGN